MNTDASAVLIDGPWEHRFVSANGARFHVAELGEGPLIVLLHGFPQFWWAWRHQMMALAEAGFRVVAPDLRGFGASDKPPAGYDVPTACADISSIIRSLGEDSAVVIGHGLGGAVAWSLPYTHPERVWAFGSIGMPHPSAFARGLLRSGARWRIRNRVVGLPRVTEREFTSDPGAVHRLLSQWASPHRGWPGSEESSRYAEALTIPFAAHGATAAQQWLTTSLLRGDGRAFLKGLARPLKVPALLIRGVDDQVSPASAYQGSIAYAPTRATVQVLTGAGHFPHEERPESVNAALINWLDTLG